MGGAVLVGYWFSSTSAGTTPILWNSVSSQRGRWEAASQVLSFCQPQVVFFLGSDLTDNLQYRRFRDRQDQLRSGAPRGVTGRKRVSFGRWMGMSYVSSRLPACPCPGNLEVAPNGGPKEGLRRWDARGMDVGATCTAWVTRDYCWIFLAVFPFEIASCYAAQAGPWAHSSCLVSDSQVLGSQACITTPDSVRFFLLKGGWVSCSPGWPHSIVLRMNLNSWSSCLPVLSAGVTGAGVTWFMQCYDQTRVSCRLDKHSSI